jgi:hypothetical protein
MQGVGAFFAYFPIILESRRRSRGIHDQKNGMQLNGDDKPAHSWADVIRWDDLH